MASAYDLFKKILGVVGVEIQEITSDTTTVGAILDTQLFESLVVSLQLGTRQDGDFALLLEHGDDSGLADAAVVGAEDLVGSLPSLDTSDSIDQVGYVGKKRFVRASIVSTNTTNGAFASSTMIKGNPRHSE